MDVELTVQFIVNGERLDQLFADAERSHEVDGHDIRLPEGATVEQAVAVLFMFAPGRLFTYLEGWVAPLWEPAE